MEEDWASNFERALWSYKKNETEREIGETNTGIVTNNHGRDKGEIVQELKPQKMMT